MFLTNFIDGAVSVRQFAKGDFIYRVNAHARYFYEVKEGEVAIVNTNNEGKQFIQGLHRSGDCFGVTALFTGAAYTASAVAHAGCEVYTMTRDHFFAQLKEDYNFHFNVTQIVCMQLQYKTMMLEEIAIEEGEHRLLTLIHYLMARTTADNNALDITKQQLADMTGLRVETVIKTLKKIEKKGMIATRRGKIVCLSRKKQPL